MSSHKAPTVSDINTLKKMFQAADKDHNGSLARGEFHQLLFKMGFTNRNMNTAIFDAQDENSDRQITESGTITRLLGAYKHYNDD